MRINLHILFTSLIEKNTSVLNSKKKDCLVISSKTNKLYLNLLALRFSSCLGSTTQLIDFFATDLIFKKIPKTTVVIFLLATDTNLIINNQPGAGTVNNYSLESTASVFKANDWLEREILEMFGFFFDNKADSRNLLLEYTNVFKPMLRAFPSVGLFELFFDTLHQNITHKAVSLQL